MGKSCKIVIILISIINPKRHCMWKTENDDDVFELLIVFCFFPDTLYISPINGRIYTYFAVKKLNLQLQIEENLQCDMNT